MGRFARHPPGYFPTPKNYFEVLFVLQLNFSYFCIVKFNGMGTKEKLIARFKALPTDFTWNEFVRLFGVFGFELGNKGKTSGSRVIFTKGNMTYIAHKPHPERFIKSYVMKQTLDFFINNKLL